MYNGVSPSPGPCTIEVTPAVWEPGQVAAAGSLQTLQVLFTAHNCPGSSVTVGMDEVESVGLQLPPSGPVQVFTDGTPTQVCVQVRVLPEAAGGTARGICKIVTYGSVNARYSNQTNIRLLRPHSYLKALDAVIPVANGSTTGATVRTCNPI